MNPLANKRILVVVAHPDDELLGLGATMHKLISKYNVTARAIILGEGITSRSDARDVKKWEEHLKEHKANIQNAAACIGFESVGVYDFPDNRFDSVALLDLVKVIEKEKEEFKPEVIFTHHGGDTNIDHRQTFDAVVTACRTLEGEGVKDIYTFETPSSTEWQAANYPNYFRPNIFFQVEEENVKAKVEAMECYVFEKRPFPHPRSGEALMIQAQRWGIVVGCKYAEAFMHIRGVYS
ncbi:MAG: PIG-L family deacetylase [Bacteroidetes bacterium]|nr:PIG-L family deacetylase [Bacteroidota bacterium]